MNNQHITDALLLECHGCCEPLTIGVGGTLLSEAFEGEGFDEPFCNNPRGWSPLHWRYRDAV